MNETAKTSDLKILVSTALGYLRDRHESSLKKHMSDNLDPTLCTILNDLRIQIEERHKVTNSEDNTRKLVVHYTSVANIVSILQSASKKKREVVSHQKEGSMKVQDTWWRLYDSAHLNDPDEGNYLFRHMGQNKKYSWLDESGVTPAYIASFILPKTSARDASDNLVFWRTYGREGEGCALTVSVPSSQLWTVCYTPAEINQTGRALSPVLDVLYPLASFYPLASIYEESMRKQVRKRLAQVFRKSLGRIQYLYKSNFYKYERECRFIVHPSDISEDEISFEIKEPDHSHLRILRHYYEDRNLAVRTMFGSGSSITIGPSVADKEDLMRSLDILKRRANLTDLTIKPSQIRYRRP